MTRGSPITSPGGMRGPPAALRAAHPWEPPPPEGLHSTRQHLLDVLVPVEITAPLGTEHPRRVESSTLSHLQTHPDLALCVCAENAATAASIAPSHSSFQTGKPPEPSSFSFFSPLSPLNYSQQQEKQRDGTGCWARANFGGVWGS